MSDNDHSGDSKPVQEWFRSCPECATLQSKVGAVPFRCDQCGFAFFFGPVTAVGGLIVDDDRLLLVRRAGNPGKGKWGLPGGFVDQGESIEDALEREVFEETRLTLKTTEYLMSGPNSYNYRGVIGAVTDLFFICTPVGIDGLKLADGELDRHEWVEDPSEYLDHMAFESNAIAVKRWFKHRNGR